MSIILASGIFFTKCTTRLLEKEAEGFTGWNDPKNISDSELLLRAQGNMLRGDYVDAANLLMMLDSRVEK